MKAKPEFALFFLRGVAVLSLISLTVDKIYGFDDGLNIRQFVPLFWALGEIIYKEKGR